MPVSLSWFNPFNTTTNALVAGVLLAVFIYWGWDTTVAVNEETKDSSRTPGIAAVVSTLLLLGTYLLITVAAQAFAGPEGLAKNSDDVFASIGHHGARQHARQAPGARGAHLGDRLDADDDPAAHAHRAQHVGARRAAQGVRPGEPAVQDAAAQHRHLRRDLDRLVRRPDDREPEHPVRLDRLARPDDRLLPRHHRLRGAHLLPAHGLQERARTSSCSSCSRCSAA